MRQFNYYHKDVIPELINGNYQVFAHGCNCFNTMGAGIARAIKRSFPQVYKADQATKSGDKKKLGTIGIIQIDPTHFIINAYTQYDFGGNKTNVNYRAVENCMRAINTLMLNRNLDHLVLPKIGTGLAGGDWNVIKEIIDFEIDDNFRIDIYYL